MSSYNKKYYEANKEKCKLASKIYKEKNKEILNNYSKQYYQENKEMFKLAHYRSKENNKEKYKERQDYFNQRYYQENKEKLKIRIDCDCGTDYAKYNKSQHNKGLKHQMYLLFPFGFQE